MADSVFSDNSIAIINAAGLPISFDSIELIMREEDSSEAYYIAHYQHPEWPGGASGVTIAIGYDLGYADADKIHNDFDGKVSGETIDAMISVAGIHGPAGHDAMLRVRNLIVITFDVALKVFLENDMPNWIDTVVKIMPKAEDLSPDCLGALVSLAYNRGASFNTPGDRNLEMRNIRDHIANDEPEKVPAEFRSMKRLWPGSQGLRDRREHEAALFERGLADAS